MVALFKPLVQRNIAKEKWRKFSFGLSYRGKTQEFYNPLGLFFEFLRTKDETEILSGIITC